MSVALYKVYCMDKSGRISKESVSLSIYCLQANVNAFCQKFKNLLSFFEALYFTTVYAPYRKNWLSVVKALIEKRNVDVNSVDSDGDSPLHVACW